MVNRLLYNDPRTSTSYLEALIQDNIAQEKFVETRSEKDPHYNAFYRRGDLVVLHNSLERKLALCNISIKEILWTYEDLDRNSFHHVLITEDQDVIIDSFNEFDNSVNARMRRIFSLSSEELIKTSYPLTFIPFSLHSSGEMVISTSEEISPEQGAIVSIYLKNSENPINTFSIPLVNTTFVTSDGRYYVAACKQTKELRILDLEMKRMESAPLPCFLEDGYVVCENEVFFTPPLTPTEGSYFYFLSFDTPDKLFKISLEPFTGPISLIANSKSKIIFKNKETFYSFDTFQRKILELPIPRSTVFPSIQVDGNTLIWSPIVHPQTHFIDLNSGKELSHCQRKFERANFQDGKLLYLENGQIVIRDYFDTESSESTFIPCKRKDSYSSQTSAAQRNP